MQESEKKRNQNFLAEISAICLQLSQFFCDLILLLKKVTERFSLKAIVIALKVSGTR